MKNFSFLKNIFFAVAAIAGIVACDNDYDLLGSDVVDGDIHNGMSLFNGHVSIYDRKAGPVQTSNTTTNLLGSYKSVFGRVTASYVTQVQLASTSPTFTENITIDSVWVYVPYVSSQTGSKTNTTTDEVDNIYKINSQYGDTINNQFRLKITENKYFIRGTDAATGGVDTQYYYSDDDVNLFNANQGQSLFAHGTQDTVVTFSNKEIKRRAKYLPTGSTSTDSTKVIAERLAPGLFFYLDKNFFKNKVLDPSKASQLSTNAAFADYFRGVSFTASPYNDNSTMLAPTFTSGYIKVVYNQDLFSAGAPVYEKDSSGNNIIDPVTNQPKRRRSHLTMTINLKGNHVNFFDTQDNGDYLAGVNTSDATNGDDAIYLRGGAGSMAVLDIFTDEQRQSLRDQNVLINDARLKFYVDDRGVTYDSIPNRIYLYDLTNKRPLYDYNIDGTTTTNAKNSKYVYGGLYNAADKSYTIRLTHHISNLVKYQDSTNVKLGLVLTDDITVYTNQQLKTPFTEGTTTVKTTPTSNVATPLGVKLYGNTPAVEEKKRLKLEIFYTKPDEN